MSFQPGELKDHPLFRAARDNDAVAEERGVAEAVATLGLKLDEVRYLAEQRGLALILTQEGKPVPQAPASVLLDPFQRAALILFSSAVLDGIVIGWRGRMIAEREERDGEK